MQDVGSVSEQANVVGRAIPVAIGGSTILGYSWSDFVNVLASVSIGLQVAWFLYDKWCTIRKRRQGNGRGSDFRKRPRSR